MAMMKRVVALCLAVLVIINLAPVALACGPSYIIPVYVMEGSPDPPFGDFTRGNIGIVQPGFGRKTMVIAYRYLTGGSFNADEQAALIEALHGKPPEEDGSPALKAWIAARQKIVKPDEKLPEIYVERQYGGYDFFPNCSANAFEVATQTLNDRVNSFGAEDPNVLTWLAAQDTVFQNCASGKQIPTELGSESPQWLRKDREYQIGAALLYSLEFDKARSRFELIAADPESPWQATAGYLVARTLVRHASLTQDLVQRTNLYQQAELHAQAIALKGNKFSPAAKKLLGLVKYRIRPEERLSELSRVLAHERGNENVRQDLIDYVWLLRKFERRILKEESERIAANKPERTEPDEPFPANEAARQRYESIQQGKLIALTIYPTGADGKPDYVKGVSIDFKPEAADAEVLEAFELEFGRKLTDAEQLELKKAHQSALAHRQWLLAPNRKLDVAQDDDDYYSDDKLTFDLIPRAFRADDLTDWIFTVQIDDPNSYSHALRRWRDTRSQHWLLAALVKANPTSPQVAQLIRQAAIVKPDSPAFPTIAYHLARLKIASGRRSEARMLLDQVLSGSELMPLSARNLLVEQRMRLSSNLNDFLKFAGRRPVGFYEDGRFGRIRDFLEQSKSYWTPTLPQSKEEYERTVEETYKHLLPWDERPGFDESTAELFNWRFSLAQLAEAARNPELPPHLQRALTLTVWTRAVVLKDNQTALLTAPRLRQLAPEMAEFIKAYLDARSPRQREFAALNALLHFPGLSPFVTAEVPTFNEIEQSEYYLQSAWWCPPSNMEYTRDGEQVPKIVPTISFLTPQELETARRERAALIALGDAKSYLGKWALEWARLAPDDPRIPEALFIAAKANGQYKYGCNSWDHDEKTKSAAEAILRKRFPDNPWTARLNATE